MIFSKSQKASSRDYLIVVGLAVLLFALHSFNLINFHELDAIDLHLKLRGQQPAHSDIVLVTVDDASLAAFGQWPWSRGVHAVLLDILSKYHPRLVFFDILFTESSPNPEEDKKLGFAIKHLDNVILSFYYQSEKPFRAFFPIPELQQGAAGIAYVNVDPEEDGVIRRVRASLSTPEGIFYHPAVLAMSMQRSKDKDPNWLYHLPIDQKRRFWINYPGSFKSFQSVSFMKVIQAAGTDQEKEMQKLFENRIILVGQTATGTTDISHTPFATTDPGIVVQASALHTLLTHRFLKKADEWFHLLILLFLSILTGEVVKRRSPSQGLIFVVAGVIVYAGLNHLLFITLGWIIPLFAPMAAIVISYGGMLFLKYMEMRFKGELLSRELRTASRIQETFLPQIKPEIAGLDTAFRCHFAEQVGGDLYDWADLGDGQIGVCVGDVSGKGIPAALYMAKVLSDFRRENRAGRRPGEICEAMNRLLIHESNSGMFLTLLYAVVDIQKKKISFSSAGHEPMILYQKAAQKASVIKEAQGRPLGLFEDSHYQTSEIVFQAGDAFLLISDGVKELRSAQGEELGLERLADLFAKEAAKTQSAEAVIENLFQAMQAYQKGGMPPHDDRTLVCVKAV